MNHCHISQFNQMRVETAEQLLLDCCHCPSWAQTVCQGRPYSDLSVLLQNANKCWQQVNEEDLLTAFKGHALIGDVSSLSKQHSSSKAWGMQEQSQASGAAASVQRQLGGL